MYGCVLAGVSLYGTAKPKYVYVFAASYFLCCAIAALQLFGFNALWLYPGGMNYYDPFVQENAKFLGTVGNIDVLSALHCLAIPLLLSYIAVGGDRRRFLLLIPVALGTGCVLAARVASGILALGCTAAVFMPVLPLRAVCARRGVRLSSGRMLAYTLAAAAVIFAVAAAVVRILPVENGTLYELKCVLRGRLEDSFGSGRIGIWRDAWRVVRDHPLFGIGPDHFMEYTSIRSERWSEALGELLVTAPDNAHNEYLQLLLSFGVCGFLPVLLLLLRTCGGILARAAGSKPLRILAPCMLCYLIQAFFNIGICIVMPLFVILWGLALRETAKNDTHIR